MLKCFAVAWLALGGAVAWAGVLQAQVTDTAGKPLEDAVIFLEAASSRAAVRARPGIEVEQASKQFAPRVSVVTVGTSVTFPNRDTVRHHVYSFSPAKTFELKLYTGTPSNPVLFDKPGIVVLGCNIHDHMVAWVVVVDTPFHGKTGATGQVTLLAVPAGAYTLRLWHPSLPVGVLAQEQSITVTANDASVALSLKGASP